MVKAAFQKRFIAPAKAWKRVVAFILDFMVIDFALFWPFESIFSRIVPEADMGSIISMQKTLASSPGSMGALVLTGIIMGLIFIAYFVVLEHRLGQSIGKMLMNISVISEIEGKVKSPRAWQCIVRSALWIPMFPFMILWVIDPLYALFNSRGQRLLEMLSRTSTVESYIGIVV